MLITFDGLWICSPSHIRGFEFYSLVWNTCMTSSFWFGHTKLVSYLQGFIEVPVPRQESEQSCSCVLQVSILPLSTIFLLEFLTVTNCYDSVVFCLILLCFGCHICNWIIFANYLWWIINISLEKIIILAIIMNENEFYESNKWNIMYINPLVSHLNVNSNG